MRPAVVLVAIILGIQANRPVPTVVWSRGATAVALEARRIDAIPLNRVQAPGGGFKGETARKGIVVLVMAKETTGQARAVAAETGAVVVNSDLAVAVVTGLSRETGFGRIIIVPVCIDGVIDVTRGRLNRMTVFAAQKSCAVGVLWLGIGAIVKTTVGYAVAEIPPDAMTVGALGSVVVIGRVTPLVGPGSPCRVAAGVTGLGGDVVGRNNS